jgi:hypothetical protein
MQLRGEEGDDPVGQQGLGRAAVDRQLGVREGTQEILAGFKGYVTFSTLTRAGLAGDWTREVASSFCKTIVTKWLQRNQAGRCM